MKGFVQDIEGLAVRNEEFRRVLYTAKHCQLVVMALKPKKEIGAEVQPSEIVEFTTGGKFIAQLSVDPAVGGSFGLGLASMGDDFIRFAAVDDNTATIMVWTLPVGERH
jgi:hypothetical protein